MGDVPRRQPADQAELGVLRAETAEQAPPGGTSPASMWWVGTKIGTPS